ncbi:signal transduction protein [Xanthomonas fragariae]|uniref:histidine kinase n=1 Tax=Xanthomonas fragariae TaxID=48664 RepID=A0A1Y6H7B2_9XANT|nr:putative diguanylate cyclase [Xanthomonas fragariae]SMR03425.1 signal transduction protein [Xanthomonas fragariae]
MDSGFIASMLQHPLTSAMVLLDARGQPLAANSVAQSLGLPATLGAYAEVLESSRAQVANSGGMAACVLPGTGGVRLEGWLRAVCDEHGKVMAFTLSIPEPMGADGTSRWEMGLDSADHGLWDWDISTDVVYRSKRWTRMLGYCEQPLPNNLAALSGLIHPDDHAQVSAAVQAHLDGRTDTYVAEFRLRQHDGQWRWILDRGRVVARTADGRPLRMVGTHTDVHHYKLLEQQLREQQAQLEEFQRIASMGSWSWDALKDALWVSSDFLQQLGITHLRLHGIRDILRLLGRPSVAQLRSAWRKIKNERMPVHFELEINGLLGAYPHHLRVWAQPVFDGDGSMVRVLGQLHNVTE